MVAPKGKTTDSLVSLTYSYPTETRNTMSFDSILVATLAGLAKAAQADELLANAVDACTFLYHICRFMHADTLPYFFRASDNRFCFVVMRLEGPIKTEYIY